MRSARAARLLDVHSDPEHHRSVYTLVADEERAGRRALRRDRAGSGADRPAGARRHPPAGRSSGRGADRAARRRRRRLARAEPLRASSVARVGEELGLPVFLYGESGGGRRPSFFRRGGPKSCSAGSTAASWIRTSARGGSIRAPARCWSGARAPLVAFNIELANGSLEDAQAIAAAVRESSGGMPGVQALGLGSERAGVIQVSINVIDVDRAPPADVVARIVREASARGVELGRSELVGLLPERCRGTSGGSGLDGLPDDQVLERRLASL